MSLRLSTCSTISAPTVPPGFIEIAAIARRVRCAVDAGDNAGAAAAFVDYWNGAGTWAKLSSQVRKD